MIVSKIASACFNDIVSGLAGYHATVNLSLEQLEDEVVETRMYIIKLYSLKNIIPKKDLFYAINCIPVDCKSLDRCCEGDFSKPIAHFEIPQVIFEYGQEAFEFVGSTDRQIQFKVYTSSKVMQHHKYKKRGADKPFVYIDPAPNENGKLDGFIFNAPLLERLSVVAIFKDPRDLEDYACCGQEIADNMTWLDTEVKQSVIKNKLMYYRQYLQQPLPNDQTPK